MNTLALERPTEVTGTTPVEVPYEACPLCGSPDMQHCLDADCSQHPLWQKGLPTRLQWMHCPSCGHSFRRSYFNQEGLRLLFGRANAGQVAGGDIDRQRALWADTVDRISGLMPEPAWLSRASTWLDIGCGNGGLVFTADEFGFNAIGVDLRETAVQQITSLGYNAVVGDLADLEVTDPVHVISLADVLEHVPYPRKALQSVFAALQPKGVLFVSCPNSDCGSWRAAHRAGTNPYWGEIEHYHNFSRPSLMRLLAEEGFMPVSYQVSHRYKSCMEVIAVRLQRRPGRPGEKATASNPS